MFDQSLTTALVRHAQSRPDAPKPVVGGLGTPGPDRTREGSEKEIQDRENHKAKRRCESKVRLPRAGLFAVAGGTRHASGGDILVLPLG